MNLRKHVLDEKMWPRGPILMIFTTMLDKQSLVNAEEFALLAEKTKDMPKVVRADCMYDFEACDLLLNHIPGANKTFPVVMMLTPGKAHLWNGTMNHKDIADNFVLDHKYQNYKALGGPSMTTKKLLEKGKSYVQMRMKELGEENMPPKTPYLIDLFDKYIGHQVAPAIGYGFFLTGLDFWEKNSKIVATVAVFFVPMFIALGHLIQVCFFTKEKDEQKSE